MLYTFTVVVNLIALAVAVWLGIYIISRSPRSGIAWLAGLALWSIAGFFLNVLLALNPPPSPALMPLWLRPLLWFWPAGAFDNGWGGWLQGWQITPAIMIWHHITLLIRTERMNPCSSDTPSPLLPFWVSGIAVLFSRQRMVIRFI
jgi:hypothetical protein